MSHTHHTPLASDQRHTEREAMLLALAALNGLCPEDIEAAKRKLRQALGLAPQPRVRIENPVPEAPMIEVKDPPRLVERQKPIWRGA